MRTATFSIKKARKLEISFPALFLLRNAFSRTEKKRNTPNTCESDNCVDDSAENGILSAEDPGHNVELEKSDASPVERADNA